MPGFLYFIPTDRKAAAAALLKSIGLEYSLAGDQAVSSRYCANGPGSGGGLIVTHNADDLDSSYKPDAQTWRKGPSGKFFVGRASDAVIGPAHLARAKIYDGTPVRLLDGNDWIVPRCFGLLENRPTTLPHVFDLDDESDRVMARVDPRFDRLCKGAFDFWMEWSGQAEAKTTGEQRLQLAIDALAVNYRLSRIEAVGCLSLLGTDQMALILRAMIDADEIEAFAQAQREQKKTT